MAELYEDTVRKIDYLEARGFEVIQKWECELKEEMNLLIPYTHAKHSMEDVRTLQNYITNVKETRRLSKCHIYRCYGVFSIDIPHIFYFL